MIEMRTAFTLEIDDEEDAVAEILDQLQLEQGLRANTVGIINCFSDAVDTGVMQAVSRSLPFDTVGFTSSGMASGHQTATIMLTVSVLTSDDVCFATVGTESLMEEQITPVSKAYQEGLEKLNVDKADLILAYAPMIHHVGGELLLQTLDQVCQGTPVFGSIAADHTELHDTCKIFCNGVASDTSMCFILMSGAVQPHFIVETLPDEKVQKQKAIITKSDNNIIYEVNDMPFLEYMKTLGLSEGEGIEGAASIPIIVDYKDGTRPVARVIFTILEGGGAVCGGAMPENATLAIGSLDYEDILSTARIKVAEIAALKGYGGALLYPCLARAFVLGAEMEAELDIIRDALDGVIPYQAAYSGGEMCPLYLSGGGTVNRFHNFTFTACLF